MTPEEIVSIKHVIDIRIGELTSILETETEDTKPIEPDVSIGRHASTLSSTPSASSSTLHATP